MNRPINESTYKRLESLERKGRLCKSLPTCYHPARYVHILLDMNNGTIYKIPLCETHSKQTEYMNCICLKIIPY